MEPLERKLGPSPPRRPEEKDLGGTKKNAERHSHLTVLRTEGHVGLGTAPCDRDLSVCSDQPDSPAPFSEAEWFKEICEPLCCLEHRTVKTTLGKS